MTPDPDDLDVLERALHTAECLPGQMSYERYARRHREQHARFARLLLATLHNFGKPLTDSKEA